MGWLWTPGKHGKGQATAKPDAAKGSGTGQPAKGGHQKHDKAHGPGVRSRVDMWTCAVCMHDNAWGKNLCGRCKSGWQDSFPKANGGNGTSKANWAKHAGGATSSGKGHGGKWTHVPSKYPPRTAPQADARFKPSGSRWFKPDTSGDSDDEGNDPKASRSTGDGAEETKDEQLKASILEAEGEVAAFRRILKSMEREIADSEALGVFSASLLHKEEQLKLLRGERKSALPVPELRRRAEKDRDAVAAKVQRTEQQLEENQQQQDKLEEQAGAPRDQHAAQIEKLERLKQQVAGFARDEAGNIPCPPVDTGADKQKHTKEAQEAVRGANVAKADANVSKAQFDRQTELLQLKNQEVDRVLAEGIRAIELATSGQAPAAAEALAKAMALFEATAKRAAGQGGEDGLDSMEVEQDSNKKAKTSAA